MFHVRYNDRNFRYATQYRVSSRKKRNNSWELLECWICVASRINIVLCFFAHNAKPCSYIWREDHVNYWLTSVLHCLDESLNFCVQCRRQITHKLLNEFFIVYTPEVLLKCLEISLPEIPPRLQIQYIENV